MEDFSPLKRVLNKKDYYSVIKDMRLENGDLWPIPINLDVDENFRNSLSLGQSIYLKDKEGFVLATLQVEEIWKPDLLNEALLVYDTVDQKHPAVNYLLNYSNPYYIAGKIKFKSLPNHYDFREQRHTPSSLKSIFKRKRMEKNCCISN